MKSTRPTQIRNLSDLTIPPTTKSKMAIIKTIVGKEDMNTSH
jgi:hypothetical protein